MSELTENLQDVNNRLANILTLSSIKYHPQYCMFIASHLEADILGENGYLGDNCIQNFHLGSYIVGYTAGNFVLKHDFRTYIRRYTSTNENFEYGYPHSNALLQFYLYFEHYMPHKATCHSNEM